MGSPKYVIGICSCTVNGGMYWQSYATAKKLDEYMPVDLYIAGCMPRPEAVMEGMQQLMEKIKTGEAESWKKYYSHYDYYLGNQQHLFGNEWQTPTDIIGEAESYRLMGPQTLGEHTKILQRVQKPLEPLEMKL
jgi:NADH-quinone oxidoreductase subunit B